MKIRFYDGTVLSVHTYLRTYDLNMYTHVHTYVRMFMDFVAAHVQMYIRTY